MIIPIILFTTSYCFLYQNVKMVIMVQGVNLNVRVQTLQVTDAGNLTGLVIVNRDIWEQLVHSVSLKKLV